MHALARAKNKFRITVANLSPQLAATQSAAIKFREISDRRVSRRDLLSRPPANCVVASGHRCVRPSPWKQLARAIARLEMLLKAFFPFLLRSSQPLDRSLSQITRRPTDYAAGLGDSYHESLMVAASRRYAFSKVHAMCARVRVRIRGLAAGLLITTSQPSIRAAKSRIYDEK